MDTRRVVDEDTILKIWEATDTEDCSAITVPLLLVPYNDNHSTSQDSQQIVSATFDYIKQSSCRL